ncbi:sugar phosphate isomerase/epimerase [Neobacillus sp. DY30]|uniref:sugar phosphate isomerase/epimerase family protein n=1 Tax=Neobacillus sp. DY30 TaxID=3047871 RepID=UPI0024BF6C36|nr:sugar phosphate isomerase/epimerase [Neobacillus sp. DY30]WHY00199.1 sugar phosphate isomerase/epimerase [Neobacillus sp. DY30]
MQNVIVPLNAFDRVEVLEKGQTSFIKLISESGAYGVEIRRELFSKQELPLERLKHEIEQQQLFTVYSAPVECWKNNHQFNEQELTTIFQEGKKLGAKWIKVSLGHFDHVQSDIFQLRSFLQQYQEMQLFVENDQTLYGGNVTNLKSFFESAAEQDVPVKMTFDVGNWYYSNQDVESALSQLAPYVNYLHLKQVDKEKGELVTRPLQKHSNHSWEKVMNHLPSHLVKALEFPIQPKEKTKEYIQMITESEALT